MLTPEGDCPGRRARFGQAHGGRYARPRELASADAVAARGGRRGHREGGGLAL